MAKRKREAVLNAVQITQQITKNEFWGWTQPPATPPQSSEEAAAIDTACMEACTALDAARSGNILPLLSLVFKKLAACDIIEAHGIIHDADEREVWDEAEGHNVLQPKPMHVHILLKFRKSDKYNGMRTLPQLAKNLGIEEQYLEKPNRGANAYDNMLAYLIHVKYMDKHQYAAADVKSLIVEGVGKLYSDYYAERRGEWLHGRAAVQKKKASMEIDDLLRKIVSGEVSREQVLLTDSMYYTFCQYGRQCDDAFRRAGERRAQRAIDDLNSGKFKISVFYFVGEAGRGKSRIIREFIRNEIARHHAKGANWSFYKSSDQHPLDDYLGEEILFMDDVRGSAMTVGGWLNLLENYDSSRASARYHDKPAAPHVIVISSTKEPLEFFFQCKDSSQMTPEAMDQFLRRIVALCRVFGTRTPGAFDPVIRMFHPVPCPPYHVPLYDSETAPLLPVSYKYEDDGREYDRGEIIDALAEIIDDASDASLLAIERGPGLAMLRGWREDCWWEQDEPQEESQQEEKHETQKEITLFDD